MDSTSYQDVLEFIEVLKLHKDKSEHDMYILKRKREEALENPTLFIELIVNKQLNLPKRRRIPCLPRVNIPSTSSNTQSVHLKTPEVQTAATVQKETTNVESTSESTPAVNGSTNTTNETTEASTSAPVATVKSEGENKETPPSIEKIRGRVYTPEKPKSFNKLWDAEEQRRLEELLLIYPDETVAAHRWKKIADALGNRTPKQVASRTQKYFIKLAKKGKPVPGKMPNLEYYLNNKNKVKKKKKSSAGSGSNLSGSESKEKKKKDAEASYYTPPPVYMSDDENEENGAALSDSLPSVDADLKDSSEYKELVALLKFKQHNEKKSNERIVDPAEAAQTITHEGYKCDSCGTEPIVGPRWHCSECTEEEVDLCDTCKVNNTFSTALHSTQHSFNKVEEAERIPYYLDYNHQYSSEEPNYLDPSFMSA